MKSMKLSVIPLDPDSEEVLGMFGKIQLDNVLTFRDNSERAFSQLRQIDGLEKPTVVPCAFFPEKVVLGSYEVEKDEFFGEPLTFVYADQVRNLDVGTNPHNKAIKAYFDCLPPKTRILLYWHNG